MKLSVNVEADAINVLALNMGRIAVDIDGIELSELVPPIEQALSDVRTLRHLQVLQRTTSK